MYGWYKLQSDTSGEMKISYSVGKNQSCDGVLSFNKDTQEITVEQLSSGTDDWQSRWLAGHIAYRISKGDISETKKMIAIG